jgi:hypothetical protein
MRTPGLYACWCMRRIIATHSSSVLNQLNEHLLAGRVNKFELIFPFVGLRQEVSCLYTILDCGVVFREVPLQTPHVHFREDGREMLLVEGASAWNAMHRYFHLTFMPYLLLATARTMIEWSAVYNCIHFVNVTINIRAHGLFCQHSVA